MKTNLENEMKLKATQADLKGGKLGNKLRSVYSGFFGDIENMLPISKTLENTIKNSFPKRREFDVLEIGANNGDLANFLIDYFETKGIKLNYTISDINQKALDDNTNPKIKEKISFDNKQIPYKKESFDFVLARSVLQYEENIENLDKALEEISRVIKKDRFFINHAVITKNQTTAKVLEKVNSLAEKYVSMLGIYNFKKVKLKYFKKVNISKVKTIPIKGNSKNFFDRYNIKSKSLREKKLMRLYNFYSQFDKKEIFGVKSSKTSFSFEIPYKVFICKK